MTMTPRERLNEMLARANAATKGPWFDNSTDDLANCVWNTDGFDTTLPHDQEKQICGQGFFESHRPSPEQHDKNMRFIAHARTDVPALVKCLLAVMDELKHGKESELGNGYVVAFAAMVENIINRELGE